MCPNLAHVEVLLVVKNGLGGSGTHDLSQLRLIFLSHTKRAPMEEA